LRLAGANNRAEVSSEAETTKILMVTREWPQDRRYGLAKSLAPILREFEARGIVVGYLSQADMGPRAIAAMQSYHRVLLRLQRWHILSGDSIALAYGVAERINMGRLAAKVAAQEAYTHLHCHDPSIAWGYRLFAWSKSRRKLRWGVTEHGYGSYTQALHEDGAPLPPRRMRYLRRLESATLRRANWVIAPTARCREQLARDLSTYPIPKHWHAIPHPRPELRRYERSEARSLLGWEPDGWYVLGVGRLAPLKRFPELVKACARIEEVRLKLVIVGEGEQAPLQELADRLGMGDRLFFAVSDDMGLYYAAADIYVSTSGTESFGMANLEALAAGLPAICTAVGGVPEVVGAGAYLIPSGDENALIGALRDLIADPGARARLARRGLDLVAAWPAPSAIAELYLAAYKGAFLPETAPSVATAEGSGHFWSPVIDGFDLCPLPRLLPLPLGAKVLIIAPHPDDEVLACGGTLALLRRNDCDVRVVVVTDGARGDPLGYSTEDVPTRRMRESRSALRILGIEDVEFLGYPDGAFRHTGEAQERLVEILDLFQPDWLFLPPLLDQHRDHAAVSLTSLRAWQASGFRARALMWELWQALPVTWVVDIGEVLAARQQAASCYELPLMYCNYTKVAENLAAYRGLYLEGGAYGEAFLEMRPSTLWPLVDHLLSLRAYTEEFPRILPNQEHLQ